MTDDPFRSVYRTPEHQAAEAATHAAALALGTYDREALEYQRRWLDARDLHLALLHEMALDLATDAPTTTFEEHGRRIEAAQREAVAAFEVACEHGEQSSGLQKRFRDLQKAQHAVLMTHIEQFHHLQVAGSRPAVSE